MLRVCPARQHRQSRAKQFPLGLRSPGQNPPATNFVGFAAREVKTVYSYTDPNVGGSYLAGEAAAIFKRGVVSVICPVGTPAKNGKVYLRVAANSSIPTGIVGDITANADGGNTVELTMCRFTGTKDTNNVVGVRILSLNAA